MKFKKVISLVVAALVVTSATAFGEAFRFDHKRQKEAVSRRQANDLYYFDFTDVEAGMMPTGITGGTNANGEVTTEKRKVDGVDKNCLIVKDTDHTTGSVGSPSARVNTDSLTGLVGVEMRMKYEKTGESNWNSLVVQFNADEGMSSRVVCGSGNGILNFQTNGMNALTKGAITIDGWYTLKVIFDYDNQVADVLMTEESTNTKTIFTDVALNIGKWSNLKNINIYTTIRGGDWVFDYIRVSRETERMEVEDLGIQKGVPANMIAGPVSKAVSGRVNIKVNDRYKYTTTAPYISEKDNVMVTVRGAAAVFSMACFETENGFIVKNADNEFVFAKDGTQAKLNGKTLTLSESGAVKDGQLFVPAADIAKALKYECSLDKENNTLFITNGQEGGEKNETETESK